MISSPGINLIAIRTKSTQEKQQAHSLWHQLGLIDDLVWC